MDHKATGNVQNVQKRAKMTKKHQKDRNLISKMFQERENASEGIRIHPNVSERVRTGLKTLKKR